MTRFAFGVVVGVLLVPAVVYVYLNSGRAPAAASDPPMPFEKQITRKALHARMDNEIPTHSPIEVSEVAYLAGVRVYRANCAMCHGLPGQRPPVIAKGMFPPAPQLLEKDEMVTDDPPGETFWKAKNGIRLTGMPGFKRSLSTDEMWQVSLLLANADKLPPAVQQALAAPISRATSAK